MATQLGFRRQAVYHYFRSKEEILYEVRQLLTNVDIFWIQFSELSKLTGDRADMLRRDISAYVHRIANVIEAGQKDGTFVDVPPMTQALLILGMCNDTDHHNR